MDSNTEEIRIWLSENSWIDEFAIPGNITPSFDEIWSLHPEEYGHVRIRGKIINTPRWQQTYGRAYKFSGMDHDALPVPDELQYLLDWASTTDYGPFNQMLLNWYQDGSHYIGAHRDDEKELVKDSPILSISLGATRKFRMREYKSKKIAKDIAMPDGTVLVMGGKCNTEFTHEVVKINGKLGKSTGARINITFRRFKDE